MRQPRADDAVVAILTKDRPQELARLFRDLEENYITFNRDNEIHIFDDSIKPETLNLIIDWRKRIPIHYHGPTRDDELIKAANDVLEEKFDVTPLFKGSIAAARNSIQANLSDKLVLSLDDDVRPYSLHGEGETSPKPKLDYPFYTLGQYFKVAKYKTEPFDFISALSEPMGKKTTPFFGKKVSAVFPEQGTVIGEKRRFRFTNLPVAITSTLDSHHLDLAASRLNDTAKYAFTELKPAYCEFGATYSCVGFDMPRVSHIPFVPTKYRYEDYLHNTMVYLDRVGCTYFTGKDIMHDRANRDFVDHEYAQKDDIISQSVKNVLVQIHSMNSEKFKTPQFKEIDFNLFQAKIGIYFSLNYSKRHAGFDYPPISKSLFEETKQELIMAQNAYHYWPKLKEAGLF